MNLKEKLIYQNRAFTIEELENDWRAFTPFLSDKEAVEIFSPHSKLYLYERLFGLKKAFKELMKQTSKDLKRIYKNYSGFSQWFFREIIRTFEGEVLDSIEKEIWRIKFLLSPNNKKGGQLTKADIQRAKDYPFNLLVDLQKDKGFIQCPFHSEKKGSFYITSTKGNNRAYCFGCGKSFDPISFLMERDNLTFVQAVKKLN